MRNSEKLFPKNVSNVLVFGKWRDGSQIVSKLLASSGQVYFKDEPLNSENPYFRDGVTLDELQDVNVYSKWKYHIDWNFKQLFNKCDGLSSECLARNSIVTRTTRLKSLQQLPSSLKGYSSNLKVITMVRDPRAMANSRIEMLGGRKVTEEEVT